MGVRVVTNTRGHRRYTETLTGRCTICDMPTATECACGRCLDMEPMAAIQWGDGPDDPDTGVVLVPFDVLLGAVTEGWGH